MVVHRTDLACHAWMVEIVLLLLILTSMPGGLRAQRVCCEGDMWLNWNHERRESYVWGYMIGYSHAYWEGCRRAMKSVPAGTSPESIENGCRENQPDFSKGSTYLVQQITDFYKMYQSDRDNVDEVLEQLTNGRTLEQIHKYPFMRRRAPQNDVKNKAGDRTTSGK